MRGVTWCLDAHGLPTCACCHAAGPSVALRASCHRKRPGPSVALHACCHSKRPSPSVALRACCHRKRPGPSVALRACCHRKRPVRERVRWSKLFGYLGLLLVAITFGDCMVLGRLDRSGRRLSCLWGPCLERAVRGTWSLRSHEGGGVLLVSGPGLCLG